MIPILVFSKGHLPVQTTYEGMFPKVSGESTHQVVGLLSGYEQFDGTDDELQMLTRDLASSGVAPHYVVMPLDGENGKQAAGVGVGIWVDDIDTAQKLPGFTPIWCLTGSV
jgi:hypothetical protein